MAKVSLVLIGCVLAASCASHAPMAQPAAAPVVAQATPVLPAEAPKPAVTAAPAATSAASSDSGVVANKELINRGYRLTQVNGQPMYCRSQAVTGSNLKTRVCKSEAQILFEQQQAQDLTNQMQNQTCTYPTNSTQTTGCLH